MPSVVSLSFERVSTKDSVGIAKVHGGEYNGDTLYLHQGSVGGKTGIRELELGKSRLSKLPARKQTEVMKLLQQAYAQGIPPEHLQIDIPGALDAYKEMFQNAETTAETRVKLPIGSTFHLIPSKDPEKREVWYICGASGSGKSYIAKGLAEQYMKNFPERNVYLVSKLDKDETLDNIKGKKLIRLNVAKLIENPLKDLEPLRDSMIIFDDYDTFQDKQLKAVLQFIDDVAIMGRHTHTTMLCLTHFLTNYKKTRLLLNECTHIVTYPLSCGPNALSHLLKNHLGMDKEDIAKVRKGGSRWISFHKNYPLYCVTETEAYLLHEDRATD